MKISKSLMISIMAVTCIGSTTVYGNTQAGEEGEISPEEMDANFSATDHQAMMASFTSAPPRPQLQQSISDALAGSSSLVIVGKVVNQSYSYDENNLPSTNTAITISQVIRGAYPSNALTIVQSGGPSMSGDRGYMVSGTHHFNVGEEEVLYLTISADGQVEVDRGYRIFEDKIYSKDGLGIIIGPDMNSVIMSSDQHPDPSFKTINMGTHVLTKNFSSKPDDADGSGDPNLLVGPITTSSYKDATSLAQFIDLIK